MKKPITAKRLYNIALFYLSKYEASRKQVGDMLRRRVLKAKLRGDEVPADVAEMIETVLSQLTQQHFLSDARFAENKARHWAEQGKSNQYITQKLKQAGIHPDQISNLLEESGMSELVKPVSMCGAKNWVLCVRKKHVGKCGKKIWPVWHGKVFRWMWL